MVDLIPKRARKSLPFQNVFFYIALAVLILAAGAYALLIYLESQASINLQNLEGEISRVGTPAERQMERSVFSTERKINDFATIIEAHRRPSNIFPFLESVIHPQVWMSDFELTMETDFLKLSGQTLNFRTLGEQLEVLRSQRMIQEIQLSDLSIGEGGQTELNIGLTLDPEIFQ